MNRKELIKRWTAGYIQPELFYYPFKTNEEIKYGELHIRFIRSSRYDIDTKEFLPIDTNDYNTYFLTAVCAIIKDSNNNIVYSSKNHPSADSHIYNIPYGKYYIKIIKSNEVIIDNLWHEIILNSSTDGVRYTYFTTDTQNYGLYKTEEDWTNEQNTVVFECDEQYGTKFNYVNAYGVPKINYYFNDDLIYTADYKNSGNYDMGLTFESFNSGNAYLAHCKVLQSVSMINKIEVDYDLYGLHGYNDENYLLVHVHYEEYPTAALVKRSSSARGVIPTGVIKENYNFRFRYRDAYSEITYSQSLGIGYASRIVYRIDYYHDGVYENTQTGEIYGLQSQYKLSRINNPFSSILVGFDDMWIDYNKPIEIDTVLNPPLYDGRYVTRYTYADYSIENDSDEFIVYKSSCEDNYSLAQAEKCLEDIQNPYSPYTRREITHTDNTYMSSNYTFPYAVTSLDIFNHRQELMSISSYWYENGNEYILSNYETFQLFGYPQYSDDYNQY